MSAVLTRDDINSPLHRVRSPQFIRSLGWKKFKPPYMSHVKGSNAKGTWKMSGHYLLSSNLKWDLRSLSIAFYPWETFTAYRPTSTSWEKAFVSPANGDATRKVWTHIHHCSLSWRLVRAQFKLLLEFTEFHPVLEPTGPLRHIIGHRMPSLGLLFFQSKIMLHYL